jgi:hypothetical protein
MGWFSRKKKPPEGPGKYAADVVGESHYLDRLAGGKTEDGHELDTEAMLILEENNPYDENAVAVSIDGEIVGHLSRENAVQHRAQLKVAGFHTAVAIVNARIVGGWKRAGGDEGYYGVKLDLPVK